jgi:hypothetical protein
MHCGLNNRAVIITLTTALRYIAKSVVAVAGLLAGWLTGWSVDGERYREKSDAFEINVAWWGNSNNGMNSGPPAC